MVQIQYSLIKKDWMSKTLAAPLPTTLPPITFALTPAIYTPQSERHISITPYYKTLNYLEIYNQSFLKLFLNSFMMEVPTILKRFH